jgi:hypothetical protein
LTRALNPGPPAPEREQTEFHLVSSGGTAPQPPEITRDVGVRTALVFRLCQRNELLALSNSVSTHPLFCYAIRTGRLQLKWNLSSAFSRTSICPLQPADALEERIVRKRQIAPAAHPTRRRGELTPHGDGSPMLSAPGLREAAT